MTRIDYAKDDIHNAAKILHIKINIEILESIKLSYKLATQAQTTTSFTLPKCSSNIKENQHQSKLLFA